MNINIEYRLDPYQNFAFLRIKLIYEMHQSNSLAIGNKYQGDWKPIPLNTDINKPEDSGAYNINFDI